LISFIQVFASKVVIAKNWLTIFCKQKYKKNNQHPTGFLSFFSKDVAAFSKNVAAPLLSFGKQDFF